MEYLNFLEDSDKEKLELLKILQNYNDKLLTKNKLVELSGLSKYILEKYIIDINIDLPEIHISEELYNELAFQDISNEHIQNLQYNYVCRSLKFQFFIEVLLEESTLKRFQDRHHLSRASVYSLRASVQKILHQEGLHIKKNLLVGSEVKIRATVFDIISYFFFEKNYPFLLIDLKNIERLTLKIINYLGLSVSHLQLRKLFLFITLINLRIKNKHLLNTNFCTLQENSAHVYFQHMSQIEQFLTPFEYSNSGKFEESNYLLLFMFISDMFDSKLYFDNEILGETIVTAQTLTNLVSDTFSLGKQQTDLLYSSYLKKMLGLSVFRQSYTTFVERSAYTYLNELYPKLHRLILAFMHENIFLGQLNLSNNERTKLYYDFMFSTLEVLQPSELEKPIYVYVDFSHGDAYTKYICQNLNRFRDLNLQIKTRFNNDIHISLSDYKIAKLTCPQIIWKQPPSPTDWANFANKVIQLKENTNENHSLY